MVNWLGEWTSQLRFSKLNVGSGLFLQITSRYVHVIGLHMVFLIRSAY